MPGSPDRTSFTPGRVNVSPSDTQGGSRVPELGPLGSVRGALSNERPYRDSWRGDPRAPRCPMSRHRKDPLRSLTADERKQLTRLSRSLSAPAAQVERSRALLAIADGASYTAAAHQVGRRHTETISAWVSRFNREGLAAVRPAMGADHGSAMARMRSSAFWPNGPARPNASRTARRLGR